MTVSSDEQHPFVYGVYLAHCCNCGEYDHDSTVLPPRDLLCANCEARDD